ncbi:DEAD/DEAH box helicase [Shouchella plakortidis]|uniref:DEAD/DEAH box helicase n=1 Tax=Alkalicoccobacillus plakortidis TaxID=444060 RepID=A0ABT0XHR0_9BACI|nr:DEAD/DEAH box helicase [Alkalicoccobacillus plakortidis]MCM2675437.1 DEAD/DEAH box helicase [Alkalicoccobacillus plakortidis]
MSTKFPFDQLPEFLQESLNKINISEPTDIQQKMIPEALEGQSIIARSQTGTGKTLAYLLPILTRVDASEKNLQAVVLAPTQELAMQILEVAKQLSANQPLEIAAFIGGANINRQAWTSLRSKSHILQSAHLGAY